MENGTDRYLHKKFKKQLSSEPRTNHYAADHQTRNNNESVPTHSTNRNENSVNLSVLNYVKSSISNTLVSNDLLNARSNFKAEQSAKQYTTDKNDEQSTDISYIKVSVNQTELTSLVTTSSILQNTKDFFTTSTISNLESNVDNNPEPENGIQQKTDTVNEKGNSSGGKYVCTYCNLACSKPSVLQKHIRAHTNERPYPCISCGFSFKTRSNLYKHCRSRTHANRVMGNKAQEINTEIDTDSQSKLEINQNQTDEILRHPTEPNKDKNEYLKEVRQDIKTKPYKPRFHTANIYDNENTENSPQPNTISDKHANSELISLHINDLIDKNNSIVNISDPYLLKRRSSISESDNNDQHKYEQIQLKANDEQPLNLTNKNRKRCLSEVSEPTTQKSLIKELLLKNLYADTNTRCPHCKMIFQTVTELELHKIRNCKGMTKSGPRYSRSSSVNVASILTQNKNAFDNIPQLQNAVFPLKSPGPFLGKTRLVESDKSKSFSFEDGIQGVQFPQSDLMKTSQRYSLSALSASYDKIKKPPVKLFGGEVKITQTSGETKSFKIDGKDHEKYNNDGSYIEYVGKMSENRVVKSTLQSGGTVLQNNPTYNKQDSISSPDVIRVYDNTAVSPNIDIVNLEKTKFNFDNKQQDNYENDMRNLTRNKETTNGNLLNDTSYNKYPNIMDFSQNAAKLLVPNLKQLNLTIPGVPMPTKFIETASPLLTVYKSYANQLPPKNNPTYEQSLKIDVKDDYSYKQNVSPAFRKYEEFSNKPKQSENGNVNPMNLLVNGKVVRYVPGIPGPVVAETPMETVITTVQKRLQKPNIMITPVEGDGLLKKLEIPLEIKTEMQSPKNEIQKSPKSPKSKSPIQDSVSRKFARPNSLALKPSMSSLKQHHGLTPTMFNQILISPDTPRGAKKYNEHFLHGNYFSYLGLKSSTKPVYCTLNKTQPFYVPHFKKLSMYSEWRQQDHKSDKLYVSAYDSRQRPRRYTTAENDEADYIVHSSYKYTHNEIGTSKDDNTRTNSILGGYESNEDYTYIRGRGRGRYVCDQCGIRCKKPSMLKKHIRTHSNDRPYTCKHCNFSFKTKGNLTKHLKSKAHTKNSAASSSSSAQQSLPHSSDSDTDDSGMDSSDESSTRQQEHEAAYGLLSLSQKPTTSIHVNSDIGSPSSVSPSLSPTSTSNIEATTSFMNAEQLVHVSKTNYARNKILDQRTAIFTKISDTVTTSSINQTRQYMGKTNINRPLTYPYTSVNLPEDEKLSSDPSKIEECIDKPVERKNIIHFNVIKRYNPTTNNIYSNRTKEHSDKKEMLMEEHKERSIGEKTEFEDTNTFRKRKLVLQDHQQNYKVQKNNEEVMDLSKPPEKIDTVVNGSDQEHSKMKKYYETIESTKNAYNQRLNEETVAKQTAYRNNESYHQKEKDGNRIGYFIHEQPATIIDNRVKKVEYDNSAMETLADIATKQEKIEKNSVAKNVASEFLKLATKHEYPSGEDKGFMNSNKEVNEMVVKTEENKSCTICLKNFSKPSQLRLHMNIHYLERPFKCDSCSVSFRTKGHLQKHERSASHHNKLSSSPALSSSEPRPFKCGDCNIAFRIHGHLAKHLRSKMHIMKLECLAKIPFGLYAELERSNSLLTEINTADGDQCLDSLKMLAKKVFINDQSKLNQLEERSVDHIETDTES